MNNDKYLLVDPSTGSFGQICVSAVRYAVGRETYIVSDHVSFLRPLLPYLDILAIQAIVRHIQEEGLKEHGLGDPYMDAPYWIGLMADIQKEIERRGKE